MGYLYIVIAALMWSFVGVMVKSAAAMVDSSVITLCRFLFGAALLAVLLLLKGQKPKALWRSKWIWIGVAGKCANYICENIAIAGGHAYGNVVVWPVQAIFLAAVSVFVFGEKMRIRQVLAAFLCIAGVIMISFRGAPLREFLGTGLVPLLLFVAAAIGAGFHVVSQKKLIDSMDNLPMNFTVFLLASVITAVPVPFNLHLSSGVGLLPVLSLVGLGIVTGASFFLNAEALKRIPFLAVAMIGNSSVLFTLLWARLFYSETINSFMIAGAVTMLVGLVLINIPNRKRAKIRENDVTR